MNEAIPALTGIEACVFDAYGTLFDVASAAERALHSLGARWQALAELWRSKQLQYTWLRGLAGNHADFAQVTRDSLDFAMETFGIEDTTLREQLLSSYWELAVYPEVRESLLTLKARGMKLAILSNGTPAMLASTIQKAGLANLFDAVLSVEEVGVYKPHPRVYGLAVERLGFAKERMCFISSNGWDAWSAKAFGLKVVWCNRSAQRPERLPSAPDREICDLTLLPALVLQSRHGRPVINPDLLS